MKSYIGSLEQLLMFVLARLENEAHGLAIRTELRDATGRDVSPGAIYTTLDRLEGRGLVASWISDDRPVGGGRRRRYYRLEPAGARELADGYEALRALADDTMGTLARIAADAAGEAR